MKTFSPEVKRAMLNVFNGYCGAPNCTNKVHSIHHKIQNTKYNRTKYRLLIHSVFNAIPLCEICHTNKSHKFKITEQQARMYEEYLQKIKDGIIK